jgi:hypothetical protein
MVDLGQYSIIISIASLAVAISVAVINYRNPRKTEKIKSTSQARQIHFEKIKTDCLQPLIHGIDEVSNTFRLSEDLRYSKQGTLDHKKRLENDTTLDLKLWVSITNQAWDGTHYLDKLLYEDLKNHYPAIPKEIETVQKFLDEKYPNYEKKRTDLVIKLFDVLEESGKFQGDQNRIIIAVNVALLLLFNYDRGHWPNLYNVSSSDDTLTIINEIISTQPNISELGIWMKDLSQKSLSMLSELRLAIGKIIRFEGELKGTCSYLQ